MKIEVLSVSKFAALYSKLIVDKMTDGVVLIPGGSSFSPVYQIMDLEGHSKANLLLTDERLVPVTSPMSNYGNIIRLNAHLGSVFHEPYFDVIDSTNFDYLDTKVDKLISEKSDYTVFLGVGEDGHVASIFEFNSVSVLKKGKAISLVKKRLEDFSRITINLDCILNASAVYLVINGDRKDHIARMAEGLQTAPYPLRDLLKHNNIRLTHVI